MSDCIFNKVLACDGKAIYTQYSKIIPYCITHYCLTINNECPKKGELSFEETQKNKKKEELEEIIKNQPELTWK